MIVWVASFPRSGNTFLRILLHRLYGVSTSVVYDVDGVAERVGRSFVGYEDRPAAYDDMRSAAAVHVIKTHRQRDEQIHADDRVLHLVRDGRDALVSWARQASEADGDRYESELRRMIERDTPIGTGHWGAHVHSWADPPPTVLLRYEDLIADPEGVVERAASVVLPGRRPIAGAVAPTFAELHAHDPTFFRRGTTGTHRDELPPSLAELFWSRPENVTAMRALGYGDDRVAGEALAG